jgi:DnaJ-class molecular chaperone
MNAMCPNCEGMGVIHAQFGFPSDQDNEDAAFVMPERCCDRCEGQGHLFGDQAKQVLAGRELFKARHARDISMRKAANDLGVVPFWNWQEAEWGMWPLEKIQELKNKLEGKWPLDG